MAGSEVGGFWTAKKDPCCRARRVAFLWRCPPWTSRTLGADKVNQVWAWGGSPPGFPCRYGRVGGMAHPGLRLQPATKQSRVQKEPLAGTNPFAGFPPPTDRFLPRPESNANCRPLGSRERAAAALRRTAETSNCDQNPGPGHGRAKQHSTSDGDRLRATG